MTTDDISRSASADADGTPPLSFAQERLWLTHQVVPESHNYNTTVAFRLRGPLDVSLLERALLDVVHRHDTLRTTFPVVAGQPIPTIADSPGEFFRVVDVSDVADPVETARRLACDDQMRAFDLADGPVLRVLVVRLGVGDHVFVETLHHIVADGRSYELLHNEMGLLYSGYVNGVPCVLPELDKTYQDYARWQRDRFDGAERDRLLDYWREALRGAPETLDLPLDRPRPARPGDSGDDYRMRLPEGMPSKASAIARSHGATTFSVLLACYAVLLGRYTNVSDVVVGVPVSERTHTEFDDVIGCFQNLACVRVQFGDSPRFSDLLENVRDVVFGALAHQAMPFEELVRELTPQRTPARTPLFQVAFSARSGQGPPLRLPGVSTSEFHTGAAGARYDLFADVVYGGARPYVSWSYDDALIDRWRIDQLARNFVSLSDALIERPERRVLDVSLLDGQERRRVLVDWNRTVRDQRARTIPELLELSPAKADASAVVCGDVMLGYADLNVRANRFAHLLRERGVTAESLVAVLLERGVDQVMAMLAVLKAGAAYVPLDPTHPRDRLEFVLRDAGVRLVVAGRTALADNGVVLDVEVVDVDDARVGRQPDTAPSEAGSGDSLAYVIYTSGSTGTPKGVAVSHRAVVNVVEAVASTIEFGPDDVIVSPTTIAFDIAALEWIMPLARGGTVVLASGDEVRDGRRLYDLLCSSNATVMQAAPAVWQLLLDSGGGDLPIRAALVGGETLPPSLARRFGPDVSAYNVYGPTETTIWSTVHRLGETLDDGPVPIGRPLANTTVYVVDAACCPVPVGVVGECLIGGVGVARGYLASPRLTAERFVPDPFGETFGGRLYRTGDRCRFRPDGVLELVGRTDRQLKVRGFRVEPAEVEGVLTDLPHVREAVVVLAGPERQLVAYIGVEPDAVVDSVRERLRYRLPEYMVPSVVVSMPSLPRTPNGKVDVAALPGPHQPTDVEHPASEPIETRLAELWSELLQVDGIGVDDSFFGLGGHSLTVAQLRFAIEDAFDVDVPWLDLMERPTIREQASHIREMMHTDHPESGVA